MGFQASSHPKIHRSALRPSQDRAKLLKAKKQKPTDAADANAAAKPKPRFGEVVERPPSFQKERRMGFGMFCFVFILLFFFFWGVGGVFKFVFLLGGAF